MINHQAYAGQTIYSAVSSALKIAETNSTSVCLWFNGVPLKVSPKTDEKVLYQKYYSRLNKKNWINRILFWLDYPRFYQKVEFVIPKQEEY